jgi:hypothetical protein
MPRELTPKRRAGHAAFVLNELQARPMTDVLDVAQRSRLAAHYESELQAYLAPLRKPAPQPAPQPVAAETRAMASATQPLPRPSGAASAPAAMPPRRKVPPSGPPMPPREPMDWSWLADQQANLFLFAGAFLTVIAALIYVGYSGQAVGGVLKMSLLIAYTLAFLGAGWLCLRVRRVVMAGRVFFAVGALLVPMNFAAAREIFGTETEFTRESMWLAGSITSAAFYTAVAWTGLGRPYAFAAGIALISAAIATPFAAEAPFEWAPIIMLPVATGMVLCDVAGTRSVRERLGTLWTLQGRALAALALGWLVVAAARTGYETDQNTYLDVTTRWFLPVTFGAFAVATAIVMLFSRGHRRNELFADEFSLALLAAMGATGLSVAFALEVPVEGWAVASAAVAAYFGLMLLALEGSPRWLPVRMQAFVLGFGVAFTAIAATVATFTITAAWGDDPQYEIGARWFLPSSFALALFFYGCALASARMREDRPLLVSAGSVFSFAGAWISTPYALDWPAEAYAVAVAALAPVAATPVFAADDRRIARLLPRTFAESAFVAGIASTVFAATIALGTLVAAADADPYEIRSRWFLLGTFAPALGFYLAVSTTQRTRSGEGSFVASAGAMLSFAGVWLAVPYALDWRAEHYAIAAGVLAVGFALVAAASQQARLGGRQPQHLSGHAFACSTLASAAAVAIALLTLLAGQNDAGPLDAGARWFLPGTFSATMVAFAVLAPLERSRRGDASLVVSAGLLLTCAGAWISTLYPFDPPAEAYAIGIAAMAPVLGLALIAAQDRRIASRLPEHLSDGAYLTALTAICGSVVVTGATLIAAHQDVDPYELTSRWFVLPVMALAALFFAIDATSLRLGPAVHGFTLFVIAASMGTVYALEVSAEYYALALVVPALACSVAVRFAPRSSDRRLGDAWRDDMAWLVRVACVAGASGALVAAVAGGDSTRWQPQSHVFLPVALFVAACAFGFDASRSRRIGTSKAFVSMLGAACVAVPYAFEAHAAYYGLALATTGVLLLSSRRWTPSWLDGQASDGFALVAVASSTLPFLGAYTAVPRVGAGVHIGAALVFVALALRAPGARTLADVLGWSEAPRVRLSTTWLYPAGLFAAIGYIFLLRSMASDEQVAGGALALPMLNVAIGFLLSGLATKRWRPELRPHLYLMSLATAVVSLATADDAGTLAVLLIVMSGAYAATAVLENTPIIVAPAVAFVFAAVPVWRAHLDTDLAVVPLTYSLIAVAAYAAALVLRVPFARWSAVLRLSGAAYALIAPAVGFGTLSSHTSGGLFEGAPFEESTLYQFSTIAVAAVGALGLLESMLAKRRWIVVPASAVLTAALLLQISSARPDNVQAYTVVVGGYLVLLGAVGLSRLRLIPELGSTAVHVEALGASTIMLPAFVQSFDAGWRHEWLLLIEATMFLTAGIGLRRRGLIATAALFMVAVSGRLLFGAINAMPNWIVVAVCGIGLLGAGLGILLGRDRWDRWQRAIVDLWAEANRDEAAPA